MSDQLGRQAFGCTGTGKPELSLKVSTQHDVYVAVLELLGFGISMFHCVYYRNMKRNAPS